MCADDGVPVDAVDELNPRHVYLYECGASPLPGFEKDNAYGLMGEAIFFQFLQKFALGPVEDEGYFFSSHFGFDKDVHGCPKFEIVFVAY